MENITTLEGNADEIMGALAVFLTGGLPEENGTPKMKPLPTDPAKLESYRDRAIERAVDAYYDNDTSDKTLHKIGRSLHDIRVRDVLIREILIHAPGFEENVLRYLTRVADRVHPSDAAPILTICGLVEWMRGDDANVPMVHAYMMGAAAADPDYSLLTLLNVAVATGMPVDNWADAMRSLTYDDCRYGME